MKGKVLALLCISMLVACSNQEEPAITKKEEPQNEQQDSPTIVEEEGKEDEMDELYIEFSLMEEKVSINASQVGILNSYLTASKNQTEALENMTLKQVADLEDRSIYLLQFACIEGACSYLLLNQGAESTAFLAEDLARFKLAKLSPDKNHLLLIFSRESSQDGTQLVQDRLVVMDLAGWTSISVNSQENAAASFDYSWPILNAEWISDTSIGLTVPDIAAPETENLIQWTQSGRDTKELTVNIMEQAS